MLDPTFIGQAIVSTLQNMPTLVAALGGDPANIYAHAYEYGADYRLEEAINKMIPPSIMIAFKATMGGNFSGQQIWKHVFSGFVRMANQAGAQTPPSYLNLWQMIVNGHIGSTSLNIRKVQVYSLPDGSPGVDLMDTPSCSMRQDLEGMDYLEFQFVFPEIGDN